MKLLLRYPLVSASLLALLVTVGLLMVSLLSRDNGRTASIEPVSVPLQYFNFMMGGGQVQQQTLEINRYTNGRAILSNHKGLGDAAKYRYLQFDLSTQMLTENLPLFFWRSANSRQLYTMALEENRLDHLDLRKHKQWRGRIAEYGFMFEGDGDQIWQLSDVELLPDTLEESLTSILSDWLEVEVWAQHSVNFVNGGASHARWSLTILVAGWVFLSLLFYWLLAGIKGQSMQGKRVGVILLMGWMLLDMHWLYGLVQQAQITRTVYAGKSLDEQYLSSMDADYYSYFQRLIEQVLPGSPQFIYVLDNNTDYYRAKVPWLLAPHNIFSQDKYPRPEYAVKGGYVLILEQIPDLRYDLITRSLRWGQYGSLPAEPVDNDPLGVLYRIKG